MLKPKLTFVYARARAIGEPARLTAAHAKVEMSDMFPWEYFGKPWPEAKPSVTFKQLPILVVEDGAKKSMICMSTSICRYLAALGGTAPADLADAAVADSIAEKFHELFMPLNPICNFGRGGPGFEEQKAVALEMVNERLALLEPILAASGGPFCLGASACYADFQVYHHVSLALLLSDGVLSSFPGAKALMAAVEGLDGVKQYLASRPQLVGIGSDPKLLFDGEPKSIGFYP